MIRALEFAQFGGLDCLYVRYRTPPCPQPDTNGHACCSTAGASRQEWVLSTEARPGEKRMNTDKIYAEQLANEYAPKDTSKWA